MKAVGDGELLVQRDGRVWHQDTPGHQWLKLGTLTHLANSWEVKCDVEGGSCSIIGPFSTRRDAVAALCAHWNDEIGTTSRDVGTK